MPKRTMVGPASRLDQGYRGQLDDGPSPWALPLLLLMAQLGQAVALRLVTSVRVALLCAAILVWAGEPPALPLLLLMAQLGRGVALRLVTSLRVALLCAAAENTEELLA